MLLSSAAFYRVSKGFLLPSSCFFEGANFSFFPPCSVVSYFFNDCKFGVTTMLICLIDIRAIFFRFLLLHYRFRIKITGSFVYSILPVKWSSETKNAVYIANFVRILHTQQYKCFTFGYVTTSFTYLRSIANYNNSPRILAGLSINRTNSVATSSSLVYNSLGVALCNCVRTTDTYAGREGWLSLLVRRLFSRKFGTSAKQYRFLSNHNLTCQ